MTFAASLLVALALSRLFGGGEHHTKIAGWTLDWRNDPFSQRQICRLHRGAVDYERQALVFHLPRQVDTSIAAYRIDGAPALFARNDAADLARLGFALHDDDLANSSAGVVRIVLQRLKGARNVVIEPKPFGARFRFTVEGLDSALAEARSRCADADFEKASDPD
jgi:hypothetical protein